VKIVVCVNPTTGGAVDDADARIRAGTTPVSALRECDTHAVEQALQIAATEPSEVVVVAVSSAEALGAVREALALGCNRGVLVDDASLRGLDVTALSIVLAGALEHETADLVLTCTSSNDIDGLLLWMATGERLGLPALTQASTLAIADGTVTISRQSEAGDQMVRAALPCLVEVTTTINQPRYPTLKGRAAAQNKPLRLIKPEELGIDVTALARTTEFTDVRPAERSRIATVLDDPAIAPEAIVEFLRARRLL
jgi:electron transfer flavoprotein beta subunit